uniref:hypothetical protein n=1 Tax=Acaricomes phytoseiuli TaxID=291968 RepID=UPI001B7F8604
MKDAVTLRFAATTTEDTLYKLFVLCENLNSKSFSGTRCSKSYAYIRVIPYHVSVVPWAIH